MLQTPTLRQTQAPPCSGERAYFYLKKRIQSRCSDLFPLLTSFLPLLTFLAL